MSFILDALKKSENERQQGAPAEFATVPSGPSEPGTPAWLWLLGALLVVNVIVLAVFLLRAPPEPAVTARPPESGAGPAPVVVETAARPAPATFAERVAEARRNRPAEGSVDAPADAGPSVAADETAARAPKEPPSTGRASFEPAGAAANAFLPSMDELRMRGSLPVADLHLDIHVYSDEPAERFVFINMNKYRESDRLTEGPIVQEITRDGVVLEHRGTAFLLPRE